MPISKMVKWNYRTGSKKSKEETKKLPPLQRKHIKKSMLFILVLVLLGSAVAYQAIENKDIILKVTGNAIAYQAINDKNIILEECVALATGNISYCNPYPPNTCNTSQICATNHECCRRDNCMQDVWFARAIKSSDPALCDEIKPEYSNRLTCQAILTNNISYCAGISDINDRVSCEATITKDASRCNALGGIQRQNSLEDPEKITCLEGVYLNFAKMTGDVSYCKKIKDLITVKLPDNQDNSSESYITDRLLLLEYLECMADITHQLKYCSGGALCFGSQENKVKCLDNVIDKRIQVVQRADQKELKESWGIDKKEWDYYERELRYNKTVWEEYKQTHNKPPWWMLW